jgi:hypothetical protein
MTATAAYKTRTGIPATSAVVSKATRLEAQFYAAALKAHPDVPAEIACGEFEDAALLAARQSLPARQQVQANDLVQRATGADMHTRPYLDYLCKKYGALYRLPANEPGREPK